MTFSLIDTEHLHLKLTLFVCQSMIFSNFLTFSYKTASPLMNAVILVMTKTVENLQHFPQLQS